MENKYILPSIDLLDKKSKEDLSIADTVFKKDLGKKLVISLGVDETKEKYYMDFSNIPCLLISGTTGSGKSIFIDTAIVTLLLKNTPSELNFIFFDPKLVELSEYTGIPHIIYDSYDNEYKIDTLFYLIDYRLGLLKEAKVDNIDEYNKQVDDDKLPQIFAIIDESVDVMKYEKSEKLVTTILEKGIKVGIHLIIATNSYLKDDFKKSTINKIPYVLTYELTSDELSKFINIEGANLLFEEGEGLIRCRDNSIHKLNTPYISDNEIKKVVEAVMKNN